MSSLRVRAEIKESQARNERPLQKTASDSPNLRHRAPGLRAGIVEDAPTQADLDVDRRIAAHNAQVTARLAHEAEVWREQQARTMREAKAELDSRVQAKKDAAANVARELAEEMCTDALIGLNEAQSREVAEIVRTKYSGSIDPAAWNFARAEWNEWERVRPLFMKTLLADLESTSVSDLAQRWGCSRDTVNNLMAGEKSQ